MVKKVFKAIARPNARLFMIGIVVDIVVCVATAIAIVWALTANGPVDCQGAAEKIRWLEVVYRAELLPPPAFATAQR